MFLEEKEGYGRDGGWGWSQRLGFSYLGMRYWVLAESAEKV